MIHLKNLNKSFGDKKVLQNITTSFESGKAYGIVGENGAGKTTLFRCIAQLEKYEGEISYGSQPIKNQLGFLMTEPYFFSKITGREYIQLLCNARNKKNTDIKGNNIFDLPLDEYVSRYSTGMKKKLAITAILQQENKVLILDEPFNGVDIQSNMLIAEIIQKLKELGKIIVISSHIFSTLKETCDEIHLLKAGVLSPAMTKENFDDLETQMKAFVIGEKVSNLDLR